MRNKLVYGIILLMVCACIWGVFALIFPEIMTMMVMNALTGMLMAVVLSMNFLMTTSRETLTVKNAASMTVLNIASIALFVWSVIFSFLLGDFKDAERSLDGLYVGYLVIIVIAALYYLMADRGGSMAQEKNQVANAKIEYKNTYLTKLNQIKTKLTIIDSDTRSDAHKTLSQCISSFQSIPANKLNDQSVAESGLGECINKVIDILDNNVNEDLLQCFRELKVIISTIK